MIRKIHIFCLLFLLILLIGNVSANDDTNLTDAISDNEVHLETNDIEMYFKDGTSFDVKLMNGEMGCVGEVVNITIKSKTYTLITDDAGEVKLPINLNPGTYSFKTESILNNQSLSVINIVKIKQMNTSLIGEKTLKLPYKEGKYSVSLIGGDNHKLAGKTVIFSVLGKEYKKTTDSNGVASLPIGLNKGTYKVSARFEEANYIKSSISSTINVDVLKTRLVATSWVVQPGSYFSVRLIDEYNRPVESHVVVFSASGESNVSVTDSEGLATFKLSINPGIHSINAYTYDSTGFLKAYLSGKMTIDYSNLNISSDDFETFVDSNNPLNVYVTGENDTCLVNVNLKTNIYKNGTPVKTIESKVYENGIAYVNLDLEPGEYVARNFLLLESQGSENKIIVNPANAIASSSDLKLNRKGESYTVTLKNNYTGLGIENKAVVFTIEGPNFKQPLSYKKLTDKNGVASLPINLNDGNYKISYYFDGDGGYGEVKGCNTISRGNFKLNTHLDILTSNIYIKNNCYEVKLLDSNNISLKNQLVYITISGFNSKKTVTYKVSTDDDGIARLKIGLSDGTYSMKVEFKANSLFTGSSNSSSLVVDKTPNFNYTLDISKFIEHKGFKCTYVREFTVNYNNLVYKFCFGENENGFYQITDKNSYFVGYDGLESKIPFKQGIGFKTSGNNLQLIFHGRTCDVGQFSVIYSSETNYENIAFVIDNQVVAKVTVKLLFYEDEFRKLFDLGYYYLGHEFINSSFKAENMEFNREVQWTFEEKQMTIKGMPVFDNFNTIQSYLIDYKKISNEILQNEIEKAVNFNGGYDKYAYNMYLSALLTLWSADCMADEYANQLNVTWDKKPCHIVLVNLDWLGLTLDSKVPLTVNGDKNNTIQFRMVHGLLFSLCEQFGLSSTGNQAVDSVTNIMTAIANGENFVITQKNNVFTLRLVNSTNSIVINLTSGVTSTYTSLNMENLLSNIILKGSSCIRPGSQNFRTGYNANYILNVHKMTLEGYFNMIANINYKKLGGLFLKHMGINTPILVFSLIGKNFPVAGLVQISCAANGAVLEYRNKYAPANTWQYYSPLQYSWDVKILSVYNEKTMVYDKVEIPYNNAIGDYDVEKAVYIDFMEGKRDLTKGEKIFYSNYDVEPLTVYNLFER
ncbi:MAG: hypothetical protein Q4P18_00370 [Methanobrevibacter sp.]|uniref:hypothetical protein n=1 Tax=Methanobrevibacter sp. TaxID=66852 RepID=UPI0026DFE99B|nr:hypothetical protein [Methanobrevibacter sp.]MDO5847977.1 hypothetical protein [Methanobrevibacter sp.]